VNADGERRILPLQPGAFPFLQIEKLLYLFVFTQFRKQDRVQHVCWNRSNGVFQNSFVPLETVHVKNRLTKGMILQKRFCKC